MAEDRWPRKPSQNEKTFARNRQFLTFGQEGELVFRTESETKLVPPNSIKDDLIQVYHDQNGHPGEKQLTQQLQRNYFWPGLVREVQNFVKTCHNCQIRKPNLKPEKTPHGLSFTPKRPFEMLAIDLIGPLPITNRANKFALVVVDTFSKFVYTWALQTKEMRPIAAILRKLIFSKPKRPRFILSDNGTEFRLIPDLCAELGIKHNAAAPYHPQTNGAVERTNQTLKNRLFVTGSEDWDLKIDQVTHGINCSNNAVTRISPFQAEMGVNGDIFGDNIEKDEEEIGNLNEERIRTFERLLEEKDIRTAKMDNPAYEGFQVGQKVLARNLHKRAPNHPISLITHRYTGPYTIIERREQGLTYVIRNDETGATTIRHAIHLKYYHQREFPEEQVPLVPEQPDNPDEQHLFTEEMDQEVQATTTPPAAAPESFNEENPTSTQRTMREEQPSQQMLRNIQKRIDYSSSEDELYLPPTRTKISSTHRTIPIRSTRATTYNTNQTNQAENNQNSDMEPTPEADISVTSESALRSRTAPETTETTEPTNQDVLQERVETADEVDEEEQQPAAAPDLDESCYESAVESAAEDAETDSSDTSTINGDNPDNEVGLYHIREAEVRQIAKCYGIKFGENDTLDQKLQTMEEWIRENIPNHPKTADGRLIFQGNYIHSTKYLLSELSHLELKYACKCFNIPKPNMLIKLNKEKLREYIRTKLLEAHPEYRTENGDIEIEFNPPGDADLTSLAGSLAAEAQLESPQRPTTSRNDN